MSPKQFKSILIRYYIYAFFTGFHFFSAVLVPFFTDWGLVGWEEETILLVVQSLQSWFTLCIFFLEVPTGAVADFLGRKHSVTLGSFAIILATLIYGIYPNIWLFILAEFVFAVGAALTSGADKALIYDSLKSMGQEQKAESIFGKTKSIHLLGIMIAAPIGSFISHYMGVNYPMLLTAIPALIAGVVAWSIPEPKVHSRPTEARNYLKIAKEGFSFFVGHKVLRRMALNAIIVSTAAYFVIWLYQPLMKELGIPIIYFGWAHMLLVISEIIVAANFQFLTKFFGSTKKFLSFSAWITTVAFIVTALWPSLVTLVLFLVIAGGFGLTRMDLMSAHMNQYIESDNRATVLSSISMFRRLAQAMLNPIVGLIAGLSIPLIFFLVGLIPLLTFLFPLNNSES
jgi:MFS family permease